MWSGINIPGTGVAVDQTWLNTIGGNIANMNDAVTPGKPLYRAEYVVAQEQASANGVSNSGIGNGVQVEAIALGPAKGTMQYQPGNPLANAQGEVEYPVVNVGSQIADLVQAQISYQANAQVMANAKTSYASILNIKA